MSSNITDGTVVDGVTSAPDDTSAPKTCSWGPLTGFFFFAGAFLAYLAGIPLYITVNDRPATVFSLYAANLSAPFAFAICGAVLAVVTMRHDASSRTECREPLVFMCLAFSAITVLGLANVFSLSTLLPGYWLGFGGMLALGGRICCTSFAK